MKRSALLLSIFLLFVPQARPFCSVPQPRLVCAEYYASAVVVEARLLRKTPNRDKADPAGILSWDYLMNTNLVLRGKIDSSFHINEGNDSGRAEFDWVRGRSYLLFLFYDPRAKAWVLDGCGNSVPMNKAEPALAKIRMLEKHPDRGRIEGQVSVRYDLSGGIPDVRVEARGINGNFIAHTNNEGQFRFQVPIGHYELHTRKDDLTFGDSDITYERSSGLDIGPGGCAQVQIIESEGKWPPPVKRH